jgi:hypothetical protein
MLSKCVTTELHPQPALKKILLRYSSFVIFTYFKTQSTIQFISLCNYHHHPALEHSYLLNKNLS